MRPSLPSWDSEMRAAAGRNRACGSQLYMQRKVKDNVMRPCRRIYDEQLLAGRGAHLEIRDASEAWLHETLQGMTGYETKADLRRFGLQMSDAQGRFLGYAACTVWVCSTRRDLVRAIGVQCDCQQPHVEPPGPMRSRGSPQPWNMAKAINDIRVRSEETLADDAQEVDRKTC
jgi:hypothetical protein